jgi:hypothetical protein
MDEFTKRRKQHEADLAHADYVDRICAEQAEYAGRDDVFESLPETWQQTYFEHLNRMVWAETARVYREAEENGELAERP